jgi:parallel beta-helix repeat protein
MLRILPILTIMVIALKASSTNYFISSSDIRANDSNPGTSPLAPWKSFTPVNSKASLATGDTIFLKRGDTFREQMNLKAGRNLVITAYGIGDLPVISGADLVASWTGEAGIYQVKFSKQALNFFVNHKEQVLARFPDEGSYLTVDQATNDYIQDAALGSMDLATLNQSQVCVHTAQWCWEKSGIASASGNKINYLLPTLRVPTAGYGYFLYGHLSYLNTGKEWVYDSLNQLLYYKPVSGNPNSMTCEVTVRAYGILPSKSVTGLHISQIAFAKQGESGVALPYPENEHFKIDQCRFEGQYHYAVDIQGRYAEIGNCTFREVDGLALFIHGTGFGARIHHNTFRNIGPFRNSGIGQEINLSAIKGAFVDSCHIHHNDIDSTGYCGIAMDGKYNLIERNVIRNAMLINNDGAALKSFGSGSQYNIFRNNFISLSDGNPEGNPAGTRFSTPAIYLDFSVSRCTIQENTIYDRTQRGIFLNSGTHSNTVTGNVVYGANYCLDFNGSPILPAPMTGMTVKNNYFMVKTSSDYLLRMLDNTGGYHQGDIDYNCYFQPYDPSLFAFLPPSTNLTFSNWKSTTGFDQHSKSNAVSWNPSKPTDTLFINPSDHPMTIKLGPNKYTDLSGEDICGSFTLPSYTSRILIKSSSPCIPTRMNGKPRSGPEVFPNPATSFIQIRSDEAIKELVLTDLNGRQVLKVSHPPAETPIGLPAGLGQGMYLLQFSSVSGMTIKKIHIVR